MEGRKEGSKDGQREGSKDGRTEGKMLLEPSRFVHRIGTCPHSVSVSEGKEGRREGGREGREGRQAGREGRAGQGRAGQGRKERKEHIQFQCLRGRNEGSEVKERRK